MNSRIPRTVWALGWVSFCSDVASEMIYPLLPLFLTRTLGAPMKAVGLIEGVAEATSSGFRLLAGWLSDRIGRRAVIAIGLGVLGPAVWAFTVTPTPLVFLPLLVIGVAGAVRMTVTEVLVAESAPVERRATVLGTYYLLAAEVGGLAAPGLGILATAVGIAAAFSFVALGLTVLSALVVIAALTGRL